MQLIDADGVYPNVAAAADPTGLGLNPYFEESFVDLVRATSSQSLVELGLHGHTPTGRMIQDRSTFADLMTVGGTGFQLTSYVVDAQQGYLTRGEAAARVLDLLRMLGDHPQGPGRVGTIGYKGFFYHFLGIDGLRKQNFDFTATPEDESLNTVELSAIDTGLVLAGVVTGQSQVLRRGGRGGSRDSAAGRSNLCGRRFPVHAGPCLEPILPGLETERDAGRDGKMGALPAQ